RMEFVLLVGQHLKCDPLVFRFGIKAVNSRKIDYFRDVGIRQGTMAGLLIHRHPGEIPYLLVKTGKTIEYSGFAGIGVAQERNPYQVLQSVGVRIMVAASLLRILN